MNREAASMMEAGFGRQRKGRGLSSKLTSEETSGIARATNSVLWGKERCLRQGQGRFGGSVVRVGKFWRTKYGECGAPRLEFRQNPELFIDAPASSSIHHFPQIFPPVFRKLTQFSHKNRNHGTQPPA